MDMKNLVERITKDVMESLREKSANVPATSFPKDSPVASGTFVSGKKVLLLVDVDYSSEEWKKLLGERLNGSDISVIASQTVRLPEDPAIRSRIHEVINYREDAGVVELLKNMGSVLYRAVRPHQISRVAQLQDDTPSVRIILEALSLGISVTVIDSTARSGKSWEMRLDSMIRDLHSMGITVERSSGAQSPGSRESSSCEVEKGECSGCGKCAVFVPGKVGVVVDAGADRISSSLGTKGINREVAAMIDHTLLKPDATREQVIELCGEAREYLFASVCINPAFVKLSSECLKGSPVKVCTVIGFPLGATTSVTKEIETRDAIANGADEIDMVINVGALKAGNYELVQKDIEAVVEAACGRIVKVILETALLTDEEKVMACKLAKKAGADFVKTSTGFGPGGATAQDIALMRQTVGKYMGVKASGGIRDFETARKMIEAGATRIGASASVAIVKGEKGEGKY